MSKDTHIRDSFSVEQAAIDLIRGKELLIGHYGEWPAFIDVEVIRIILERAPTNNAAISNLKVIFFTFDIHKTPDDPLRKQAHTEMLFCGVDDLKIKDWAHQNPIQGLSITLKYSEALSQDLLYVVWGGLGHETSFTCLHATVVDVMDLNPFQKSLSSLTP